MRLNNIRINSYRRWKNTYRSEELLDQRQYEKKHVDQSIRDLVPPVCAYDKWQLLHEGNRICIQKKYSICIFSYQGSKQILDSSNKGRNIKVIPVQSLEEIPKYLTTLQSDYVLFLDGPTQHIAKNGLVRLQYYLEKDSYDFIYSDQDELDLQTHKRQHPFFKPDWSPHTFASFFYTGNLSLYKTSILRERFADDLNSSLKGKTFREWHYKVTEEYLKRCTGKMLHIPEILCHESVPYRYTTSDSTSDQIPNGLVSVIIPSMNHAELLEKCIGSLLQYTKEQIELIVVDNGSNEEERSKIELLRKKYTFTYHYEKMQFNFSKMCNIGAALATGSYLLFLNDDIEAFQYGWMTSMKQLFAMECTGAVGAKLYYPGGRQLQHIGVVNYKIGPGHCLITKEDQEDFYFGRNKYNYNYLAVTAACMMVRKDRFEEINGFDEAMEIGYNDVDLCMSLYEKGYYNVVCNDAVLYHHESLSRGYDEENQEKAARLLKERAYLYNKHPEFNGVDPFYSVHLTKCLSDFDLDVDYYGWKRKDIPKRPVSKVRKMRWDIKEEWVDPALLLQIDMSTIQEDRGSIEGWSFIRNEENAGYIRYMLLRGQDGACFYVGTRSCYKRYLKEQFPKVNGIEMLAFTCDFNAAVLEKGKEYQIGMLCEHKETGKIYLIFTDHCIIRGERE